MNAAEIIARESDRLASVLAAVAPATPCPSCPEWTARDLLAHLTQVHQFWATILGEDLRTDDDVAPLDENPPDLPESIDEILPIRAAATRALVAVLEELNDDDPRWSWWPPDQTVSFTRRMQVCEAHMHRVDAELTAGLDPTPLADDVAAHCITHCVDVMWGWPAECSTFTSRGIVQISAGDHTWLVDVGEWTTKDGQTLPRAVRARAGAAPDAHVTAPLDTLARWAWVRGGEVTPTGEEAAVRAMNAVIDAGIQ